MVKSKKRVVSKEKLIELPNVLNSNSTNDQNKLANVSVNKESKIIKYVIDVKDELKKSPEKMQERHAVKVENCINPINCIVKNEAQTEFSKISLQHSLVIGTVDEIKDPSVSSSGLSKLAISPVKSENIIVPKKPVAKTTNRRKVETSSQSQLTDFYKIRRSNRQTRTKVLKEKQKLVEEKIISGIEEGLEVVNIIGKGRGVVTTKEFKRGEFVAEYSGELIDNDVAKSRELEYAQDTNTGCYMYYFLHNCRKYCVDATEETGRFGRLINHSKTGNLSTKSFVIDGIPHLIFVANRDILSDEELLYDYGDRRKESLEAHPWLTT